MKGSPFCESIKKFRTPIAACCFPLILCFELVLSGLTYKVATVPPDAVRLQAGPVRGGLDSGQIQAGSVRFGGPSDSLAVRLVVSFVWVRFGSGLLVG